MPLLANLKRLFINKPIKRAVLVAFFGAVLLMVYLSKPDVARASHCNVSCSCITNQHTATRNWITVRHASTQLWIGSEFISHRQAFLMNYFFNEHVLAAMMMMTEQLVSVAMQQTLAIGAFLDAKHQMETQRLFQTMMARAHKDYHPDLEMCVIGTNAKSLASAQRHGEANAYVLSQLGIERSLNNENTNAGPGVKVDKEGRLDLFKTTFCDEHDKNNDLSALCDGSGPPQMQNIDVDYASLVDRPWTINTDFTTTPANLQDSAVTAMFEYLYGHEVFSPISAAFLTNIANHDALLDVRALAAKRAVAQNSFASLIGQKSRGSADSAQTQQYMTVLMQEFGIANTAEIDEILGERPSYYAQMEILTKQIFMRDQFYTNLYDKPVNIDRKGAAIQALSLTQNMDLFESKLRNEAMLAVLMELELEKVQFSVENKLNTLDAEAKIKITP